MYMYIHIYSQRTFVFSDAGQCFTTRGVYDSFAIVCGWSKTILYNELASFNSPYTHAHTHTYIRLNFLLNIHVDVLVALDMYIRYTFTITGSIWANWHCFWQIFFRTCSNMLFVQFAPPKDRKANRISYPEALSFKERLCKFYQHVTVLLIVVMPRNPLF